MVSNTPFKFVDVQHYDSVAVENNTLYIMNAQVYEQNEETMAPKYATVASTFDVGRAAV